MRVQKEGISLGVTFIPYPLPLLHCAKALMENMAFVLHTLHLNLLHMGSQCWAAASPDHFIPFHDRHSCGYGLQKVPGKELSPSGQ